MVWKTQIVNPFTGNPFSPDIQVVPNQPTPAAPTPAAPTPAAAPAPAHKLTPAEKVPSAQGPSAFDDARGALQQAQSIFGTGYENPYNEEVIQNTLSDVDDAYEQQAAQLRATQAGRSAFGPGAQLQQSRLRDDYLDTRGRASGILRARGYDAARDHDLSRGSSLLNASNTGYDQALGLLRDLNANQETQRQLNQQVLDIDRQQFDNRRNQLGLSLGYIPQAFGQLQSSITSTTPRTLGDKVATGISIFDALGGLNQGS